MKKLIQKFNAIGWRGGRAGKTALTVGRQSDKYPTFYKLALKWLYLRVLLRLMMKKLLPAVIFLLLLSPVFAQRKPNTSGLKVPLQIKWAKGETTFLTVTERKQNVAADEYSTISTTSQVRLRVLDKNDTSYTLEWTYTEARALVEEFELRGAVLRMGREAELKSLIQQILTKSEESITGMSVVYTTDQYGAFMEVQNRDELREKYKNTFNEMMGELVETLPRAQQDSLKVFFEFMSAAVVSDPDFGLNFTDIQLFHQPYGHEYEVGRTQSLKGTWPSPFNDNEYPVDIKLTLSEFDSSKQKAKLKGENSIGNKAMEQYVNDLSNMLSIYGLEKNPEGIEYNISSNYEINLDLNYGWIYDAHMVTYQKENHDTSTITLDLKVRL